MLKRNFIHALLIVAPLAIAPSAGAQEKSANRYPFDPACPWGRLANGKGMVVRCLTQTEAAQLSAAKASPPASAATVSNTNAPPNAVTAVPASASPAAPVVPTANGVASADVTKKTTDPKSEALEADVVAVTVDEGTLDGAKRKLRTPRDKYARCVSDNGGLSAEAGEVTVRFLVRERGRAEGTEVVKRQGLSEGAAHCVAAVVDRRPVGTPEGPAVGATVVIRIVKQSKH